MSAAAPAYGLWTLVIINSLVFIIFAFSFAKPQSPRDWRSFGAFSGFIVALFAEMYGYPLTIYLLSGWLSTHFPGVDFLSHEAGHLWEVMFGWRMNPHAGPFHVLSYVFIGGGRTILTLAMFPVLCLMYVRLARTEEREADGEFGGQWRRYAASTPRFVPDFKGNGTFSRS